MMVFENLDLISSSVKTVAIPKTLHMIGKFDIYKNKNQER